MNMTVFKKQFKIVAAMLVGAGLLSACRGRPSEQPPIHLNQNMDFTTNFQPQEANYFFKDKRSMRPLVPGVVARGSLHEDDAFSKGRQGEEFVTALPMPLTMELMSRGQERYNIFCTPCHGRTGQGNGIVVSRGMIPPPNFFADERVLTMPIGQYFDVITNGARTMPAYGRAIPPEDRWAIAAYVRALQQSRNARLEDVPPDVASSKGWLAK